MNLAWVSTISVLGNEDQFATSFYVIAGDISRIERMTDRPNGPQQFLFRGSQQEAVYLLAERPAFNQKGLYWIRLFTRSDGAETALVRMRAPLENRLQDFAGIEWRDPVVLLRGKYVIHFSYRSSRGNSTSWISNWDLKDRLPQQVRIEIRDARSGQLLRPAFLQGLKIEAEASCINIQANGCTVRSQGQLVAQ